ncbi:hypothetical protein [Robiginitalea sediminis]|uniref:hypothetical protein n=1 Tax=Robiginitalea sediminis TaxID=1982593 RepID=UPI000B4B76CB|nr:hypothetical protein [Robiginitalea sediminis]
MKAIVTLVFVLLIGVAAQAQERTAEVKVEGVKMELVQVSEIQQHIARKEQQVARLYRRSGSRVKKALSFSTKYDKGIA